MSNYRAFPYSFPGQFVGDRHLGGYILGGDPNTYAPEVWFYFTDLLEVKSVIDIGAGEGRAALWFQNEGCTVTAIEGESRGVEVCKRALGPANVIQHDYTQGVVQLPQSRYDLAWCCEFVEHVEEQYAPNFLETFRHADIVAMTHAIPGQAGYHHVNCQFRDYWVKRIEPLGFTYQHGLSLQVGALTSAYFVRQSLAIFTISSEGQIAKVRGL